MAWPEGMQLVAYADPNCDAPNDHLFLNLDRRNAATAIVTDMASTRPTFENSGTGVVVLVDELEVEDVVVLAGRLEVPVMETV